MKHLVLVVAALAPVAIVACKSQDTHQSVAEARTVTLIVRGMT